MPNEVQNYSSTDAITSTPRDLFTIRGQTTMLRYNNADSTDITLNFGVTATSTGVPYLIQAGEDAIVPFIAEGAVTATSAGTTSANIFVQVFVG